MRIEDTAVVGGGAAVAAAATSNTHSQNCALDAAAFVGVTLACSEDADADSQMDDSRSQKPFHSNATIHYGGSQCMFTCCYCGRLLLARQNAICGPHLRSRRWPLVAGRLPLVACRWSLAAAIKFYWRSLRAWIAASRLQWRRRQQRLD